MLGRYMESTKKYEGKLTLTSSPHLELNPEKTNFYDMTIDDFKMVNYEPMQPQLKLELGI